MASMTASASGQPAARPGLLICLLGRFAVYHGGRSLPPFPTRKIDLLLAYLALHPGRELVRDELAYLIWPDADTKQASGRFRQALTCIRQYLVGLDEPEESILVTPRVGLLRFDPPASCQVDAALFEQAVCEGLNTALGTEERIARLQAAVELYRGPLLPQCDADWSFALRERLRMLHERSLHALAVTHRELKQYRPAEEWARQALALDPTSEAANGEIMLCLHLQGDPEEALRQFERYRRWLAREGREPAPALVELQQQILHRPATPSVPPPLVYPELVAPFTGREAEIAQLERMWQAAGRGVGQLALLTGEPGIGKSRLGQEWVQRVRAGGGIVVCGQSYRPERDVLYQPVIRAVRQGLLLAARLSLKAGSAGTMAQLARLVPEVRERFPELPAWPPGEGESELLEGLCRFFLRLARQRPLCLFLDDLHWADDASLRFLHQLWRAAAAAPLLIVGAFRPEEAQENRLLNNLQQEVGERSPGRAIDLAGLSPAAVAEMVERLAGMSEAGVAAALPAALLRRLHRETGGNPFFLLMTLRALIEARHLQVDGDGHWRLTDDRAAVESLPVPPSIRQLILERLKPLSPAEREVLGAAAVLGQQFEFPILCRVLEQPAPQLLPAVERLLGRGLLEDGEGGELRFHHDRIQEIVYQELSSPRRQWLHMRAGEVLSTRFDPSAELRASEIAHHFLEARDPAAREPAVPYLLAAGAAARRLSAHAEACRHLEAALALLESRPADPERLEMRVRIVDELHRAYRGEGRLLKAQQLLEDGAEACRRAGYPAGEARVCTWLGRLLLQTSPGPAGGPRAIRLEALYQRVLQLCREYRLEDWIVQPRLDLAFYYGKFRQNQPLQQQLLEEVVADLHRVDPASAREALAMLMGIYGSKGQWEEARAIFARTFAYGGPDLLTFSLLLSQWEAQWKRAGNRQGFVDLCRQWQAEAAAAGVRDLPEQWLLEPAHPAAPAGAPILDFRSAAGALPPELRWIDPLGISPLEHSTGSPLTLSPAQGTNLWPPDNLNAPRLMLPVEGDFIAQTTLRLSGRGVGMAGLLLWEDGRNFVRLERVNTPLHGSGVQLEACREGRYAYLGRGHVEAQPTWLRLERTGDHLCGLCSADGVEWWSCWSGSFPAGAALAVGMACIAWEAGAAATFHRFTVWRLGRPGR